MNAVSPTPTVTARIGGAAAADSAAFASSETCGHDASSACPCASFIANARQVGTPQSPQLVFGRFLKISIPLRAIVVSSSRLE